MAYDQGYIRNMVKYDIEHIDEFSINLTWVLKAFGTNWNDGVTLVSGQNNSLDSFIDGYSKFLYDNYDGTAGFLDKYPETNQFIGTNEIYGPAMDDNDLIVKTFLDILKPLDTTEKTVIFSDIQKKAVEELGRAVYANDINIVFIQPIKDFTSTIQILFSRIWNTPYPSNPSQQLIMRLGITRTIISTQARCNIGVFYLDPEYIKANKDTLTGPIKSYVHVSYAQTERNFLTWYVDKTTGDNYGTPGSNREKYYLYKPNNLGGGKASYFKLRFNSARQPVVYYYNLNGTYSEQAMLTELSGNNKGLWESGVLTENEYKNNEIDPLYYKKGDSDGSSYYGNSSTTLSVAEGPLDPNYQLSFPPADTDQYDSRYPDQGPWKYISYIKDGVVQPQQKPAIIKPEYETAYASGTFHVVDGIDDGYLEIPVPGIEVINDVNDGTENISDVLADGGNYTADDNSIIVSPGSDVTYDDVKDVVDPGTATMEPGVNIAAGFMTTYICNEANLEAIGQKFYNPTVIEAIAKAFTDPIKLIRSLGYIPFKVPVNRTLKRLYIGGYDMETNVYQANAMFYEFSYGVIDFTRVDGFFDPNNYLCYDEYSKFAVYIPFIGYQQVNANDVMGHKVRLDVKLNIVTGDIITTYWVDGTRRYIWGGNCMISLPVTDRDFLGGVGAVAGIGAAVAAGIATGGAAVPVIAAGAGATAGAVGSKSLAPQFTTSGQLGGQIGTMGPKRPFVIMETIFPYDQYNSYNFFGGLLHFSQIQSTYCYAEIMSPVLTNIGITQMLDSEHEEIIKLMANGIWIQT